MSQHGSWISRLTKLTGFKSRQASKKSSSTIQNPIDQEKTDSNSQSPNNSAEEEAKDQQPEAKVQSVEKMVTEGPHSALPFSSEDKQRKRGLSLCQAVTFIISTISGLGILVMPSMLKKAGWYGVLLILLVALNSSACGILLGMCWIIIEDRWPEYQKSVRDPYATIAYRAGGKRLMLFAHTCLNLCLCGVCITVLLLVSEIVSNFPNAYHLTYCAWICVMAALFFPVSMARTPREVRYLGAVALAACSTCILLLFIALVIDRDKMKSARYMPPTLESFTLAFGTVQYSFAGVEIYPNIQNEMVDRKLFPKAVVIAGIFVTTVFYMPVAAIGYSIYGTDTLPNVMENMVKNDNLHAWVFASRICFCVLISFQYFMAITSLAQNVEECFNLPRKFGWKHVLIRSSLLLFVLLSALTIPYFEKIIDIIGAFFISIVITVLPPIFFYRLTEKKIGWILGAFLLELIIVGSIGGAIATYSSIANIVTTLENGTSCVINLITHKYSNL